MTVKQLIERLQKEYHGCEVVYLASDAEGNRTPRLAEVEPSPLNSEGPCHPDDVDDPEVLGDPLHMACVMWPA